MKRIITGDGKFYVYVLRWGKTFYIGSRTSKKSNYTELFSEDRVGYRTSSKNVKKFIESNGYPDTIKIFRFFDKRKCFDFETKFLKRVDARRNKQSLNLHNNEGVCPLLVNYAPTKKAMFTNGEIKLFMFTNDLRVQSGEFWSASKNTVIVNIDGVNQRISCSDERYISGEIKSLAALKDNTGEKNNFFGKKHSKESMEQMVKTRLENNNGVYNSNNPFKSDEVKLKIKESVLLKSLNNENLPNNNRFDMVYRNERFFSIQALSNSIEVPYRIIRQFLQRNNTKILRDIEINNIIFLRRLEQKQKWYFRNILERDGKFYELDIKVSIPDEFKLVNKEA